jgi:sulfopropanediol 3-dehydrogenase
MREYLKKARGETVERDREVVATVSSMLSAIERDGIAAIRRYSTELDQWTPVRFTVKRTTVEQAERDVPDELKEHIAFAADQVRGFAEHQRRSLTDLEVETLPGVVLGHRHIPVAASGAYSPGGRYPLIASSIMTLVVPKVAGVERVVAVAPPRDGAGIFPPQLYAMAHCGADQMLCLGGVQALAALAFGIEEIAPVDMIVGAGNAYVAEAKRQLFGRVGIDILAGPTEIAVIADESADPALVAADLLGQAEHGPNSPAILITTNRSCGEAVIAAVERWLPVWPTADVTSQAWRDFGEVIVVDGRDEAVAVSEEYAPEHLELQTSDDRWYETKLRNYGSLFIGREATVAYGDKGIGVNHVLPTGRAARYTGGLWVGKFLKTVTYQRVTAAGSETVAPTIAAISDAELMYGHALTARLRLAGDEHTPVTIPGGRATPHSHW